MHCLHMSFSLASTEGVGLKSTYRMGSGVSLGLGIDNITDEAAYVAHPWPGRTIYANFSYDY